MTEWKVVNSTLDLAYQVTDEVPAEYRHAPVEHPDYHPIYPEHLVTDLHRHKEARPWGVLWVSLKGLRALKRGTAGTVATQHLYSAKGLHTAPTWVQARVAAQWADAECDRTGNRPTVPTDEDVFGRPPTPADVRAWPDYFIGGPGYELARRTNCGHGYHLTDSCPNCDYEEENNKELRRIVKAFSAPDAQGS